MGDSQGQEAAKSVRVNLTIPAPVHELMRRGAALSGLSVSGFIASWLVFDLPSLRAWLRQYHNVRAGELSFLGDPILSPVGPDGFPLSGAQREDALNQQRIQAKQAQRLLDQEQEQLRARERASGAPGGPSPGGSDPSVAPVSSAAPARSTAVRASGGGSGMNRAERRAQAKVERKAGLR